MTELQSGRRERRYFVDVNSHRLFFLNGAILQGEKREKAREGKYAQDFISEDLSKKILTQARKQLDEEDDPDNLLEDDDIDTQHPTPISYRYQPKSCSSAFLIFLAA